MKTFLIGGAVRDKLLGIKSNDLDYVVVLDKIDGITPEQGFKIMEDWMTKEGFEIFLSVPEMYTSRAKFPKGHKNEGIVGDFCLARKEVGYEEGTRRPILELGNLEDDAVRRDFSVNAMAEDEEGNLIDLFDGQRDLKDSLLRTPVNAVFTFNDDPLRMMRAVRFSITKGFRLSEDIQAAMLNPNIRQKLLTVVSQERIREELFKAFKHDTVGTISLLNKFNLLDLCFGDNLWLEPTMKKR